MQGYVIFKDVWSLKVEKLKKNFTFQKKVIITLEGSFKGISKYI